MSCKLICIIICYTKSEFTQALYVLSVSNIATNTLFINFNVPQT